MPELDPFFHSYMFRNFEKRRQWKWLQRLFRALTREWRSINIYGVDWGDPEFLEPLTFIRDRYITPFVDPQKTALEIGPGGGRWTKYLLKFKKIYMVDYYPQLLKELKRKFRNRNLEFIQNHGTDFPGVADHSIDYIFSFDAFVHFEEPTIQAYLENIHKVIKPKGDVIIHYSDHTKVMAQSSDFLSYNTPQKMREMVSKAGFKILGEDLTTMWHSSIIHFTL